MTHSRLTAMMKKGRTGFLLLVILSMMISIPAFAQRRGLGGPRSGGPTVGGGPRVGGGFIPPQGPEPSRSWRGPASVAPNHPDFEGHPIAPHVHWNGQWVGQARSKRSALHSTSVEHDAFRAALDNVRVRRGRRAKVASGFVAHIFVSVQRSRLPRAAEWLRDSD